MPLYELLLGKRGSIQILLRHINAAQVEGYAVITLGKLILEGEIKQVAEKIRSNIRHTKEIF